jgi:hypothetical protein
MRRELRPVILCLALFGVFAGARGPSSSESAEGTSAPLWMKVFGQRSWSECVPGKVNGRKVFHPGGVLVDRNLQPNAIYVADMGNSRVLGFRSESSAKADLVFGQPDAVSSAPNGDANVGRFGPASATSLCLFDVPRNTNEMEQSTRLHFDVDSEGSLYVPDIYNQRVVVFRAPFSADKSGGKGDTIADLVLGQNDMTSNRPNRGLGPDVRDARCLAFTPPDRWDQARDSVGVSVGPDDALWVADPFNHRVLRFPKGSTTPDLVLGQDDFISGLNNGELLTGQNRGEMRRFCWPAVARIDPPTGELYVLDQYFPDARLDDARLLVFKPPFRTGMSADRELVVRQPPHGDFLHGFRVTRSTGFAINPVRTDDWVDESQTARYRDGVLWLHSYNANPNNDWNARTILLDRQGNVLVAISAPDTTTFGGKWKDFQDAGLDPLAPYNLAWPGGNIGFDSRNNIYLADETFHRVSRYALPYRPTPSGAQRLVPPANGGVFGTPGSPEFPESNFNINNISPARFCDGTSGVLVIGKRLMVRGRGRLMVWDNYLRKPDGAAADFVVGQADGKQMRSNPDLWGNSQMVADDRGRLWMGVGGGGLLLYALPLTHRSRPLASQIPLFWADKPRVQVDYEVRSALAFEKVGRHLWLFDRRHHRLLRVRNPDNWRRKLLVDAVIGQDDRFSGEVNRGNPRPDDHSFGEAAAIRFDRRGNLFVVDNDAERQYNARVVTFMAEDLAAINTLFPAIRARLVYCADRLDDDPIPPLKENVDYPFSPMSVAFSHGGEMVIGNDGYANFPLQPERRGYRQLFLYRRPLEKTTPDAVIELPLGAAGDIRFDPDDNLIVQDPTYNRLAVINFYRDPGWLRELSR